MKNENNYNKDEIEERLNLIKNKANKNQHPNNTNEEISIEEAGQSSNSLDLDKLKDKLKIDNAPLLREVKDLNKNIKKIKNEFAEANNTIINKDKFLNFIKQANEMSKNYEKQLQYYSMYNGKYNTKDLSIFKNEKQFSILADKRKVFESELNKLDINFKNPDFKKLQKLYQEKIESLFNENKNLNKIIEKMSNEVVMNFQNRIQDLFDENTKLKKRNSEIEEKLINVKFIFSENNRFFEELNEKDLEIIELNKQQIIFMNKHEKAVKEIEELTKIIKINNEDLGNLENENSTKLEEIKKLKNILKDKENLIKEKNSKISEQDKQLKILVDDNIQWEQKYNDQIKENENFKKWAMWDQDLIESFRKIEKLTNDLNITKTDLDKLTKENKNFEEINSKLKEELCLTQKNKEKLQNENNELNIIKNKYEDLEIKLKDYLELKKQNDIYKKEMPAMKDEYETKLINDKNKFENYLEQLKIEQENKINELISKQNLKIKKLKDDYEQNINKLNDEIQNLKDKITILNDENTKRDKIIDDLNNQINKKTEVLSNLKKSYDNLIKKIKISEEKLAQYEQNNKKHKSIFNDEEEIVEKNSINNKNIESNNNSTNNNENKRIITTFDQFSFTKEILNDYLYCLYLLETGISIQSLVSNIMGNLNLYSNYSFRLRKDNNNSNNIISNYPLNTIQNEFIEDVYFVSFDKYISKKVLFNKDEIFINGYLDQKILKANFEDFDQGTINEICLELINKNIMTKFKSPKTLAQLSQLFNSKYNKKFDFEGVKLSDYLTKEIVPTVQKRILKYNKSIIDEMRTLVELSLHNLHDGKIIIDEQEVYSFEKYFEQYNNYTNISERNLKIDVENAICDCSEAIDNLKHTLKYYYPQIIRLDNCFKNEDNANLGYINKILAAINYYQINATQLSFINNKLDKIFNKEILTCIKLIKTLVLLDLSNNGISEDNIKNLLEYLKENKTIKILYLNNNNLTSNCGYYLADCFKKNTSIEILHLSHNKINESGLDSFLNILGNDNSTLKELDISYNDLSIQDFKMLSDYLNLNPPLKSLDISGNDLGGKSANLIGVTFKKLTNLEEIKLNDCGITDETTPQVLMYLNESNIHNLEIDSNKFGPMAPMLILKKIQISNKLKYISFQKMEFQPYFVDMIIQAININTSIERINLKNNKIKEEDLKKFANASKNVKFLFSRDMVPTNASEIISGHRNIILQ